MTVVRVFISYAHDDPDHVERVRAFWEFLRGCGIDARFDLEAIGRRRDWTVWMEDEIRQADFVLVVASREYKRRASDPTAAEVGRGVRYETVLLREWLYGDRPAWFPRILPVVLPGGTSDDLPVFFQPSTATVYHVAALSVAGADELLRTLTNQPLVITPALGPPPVLPPLSPTAIPDNLTPSTSSQAVSVGMTPQAIVDELAESVTVQSEAGRLLLIDLLQDHLGPLSLADQLTVRAAVVQLVRECWRLAGGPAALAQVFRLLEPGARTDHLLSQGDAGVTHGGKGGVAAAQWKLMSDLVDALSGVITLQSEGGRQVFVEIVTNELGRPLYLRAHAVRRHQDIELVRACMAVPDGLKALAATVEWLQPGSQAAISIRLLIS